MGNNGSETAVMSTISPTSKQNSKDETAHGVKPRVLDEVAEDPSSNGRRKPLPLPHTKWFILMIGLATILTTATNIRRVALVWNSPPETYGFFVNNNSDEWGVGGRKTDAVLTIALSSVFCMVLAFAAKYLLHEWVDQVAFTDAAVRHGVEDDDEFLHLMAMSFVNLAVFNVVAPVQLFCTMAFLFSGSNAIRVDPAALQTTNFWVVVAELAATNGVIFTGYILFEFIVWFLGWEKYSVTSFLHHGGFLLMSVMVRGLEVVVFVGSAAMAMEISSPPLVIHMCARQLKGWEKESQRAFTVFAPLFVLVRLVLYSAFLVLLLTIYFGDFGLVSPHLVAGWTFHIIVWLSFLGGVLQWTWAPILFQKIKRKFAPGSDMGSSEAPCSPGGCASELEIDEYTHDTSNVKDDVGITSKV